MNDFQIYAQYIANRISLGSLITKDRISSIGIKPLFDRILTKKFVTKIWCVTSVPVQFDYNLTQALRSQMFKSCRTCKTMIYTYNTPTIINTGEVFTRQLHSSANQYEKYKEIFETLKEDEKQTGKVLRSGEGRQSVTIRKETLKSIRDKYDSYSYVYNHTTEGGTFSNTYYFVICQAPSNKELKSYRKELIRTFKAMGVIFTELHGNMPKFLKNFGVSGYKEEEVKQCAPILMSDENLSCLMSYKTRGVVGNSKVFFGLDWLNKSPLLINLFESSSSQVIALIGQSGFGKTYAAFQLAMSLVSVNVHCSAIDIKGGEWVKLNGVIPCTVVSMDDRNPRCVNTLRLDDVPANEENCEEYYNMAVKGTTQMLSLMVNLQENEGNSTDLNMILEQAIQKYYSTNEVNPRNYRSFIKTKGFKYSEILPIVSDLAATKTFTDKQRSMCNDILTRCSVYLSSESRYSAMFRDEITVGEILESPMVIYSFNKNRDSMLDNLDTLRVFMVQFLDNKKHTIRRENHLHSAAFYEELQRCSQFSKLVDYISAKVTGSRSDNVIIFLLLNAITVLSTKEFSAIRSNIKSYIVGMVSTDDINILSSDFDCKDIEDFLIKIRDNDNYRNCFAIKYDTGKNRDKTIYKVVLPEQLELKFRTRDVSA